MEWHSPVPQISSQSLISHNEGNKNTDLKEISMQRHSSVYRVIYIYIERERELYKVIKINILI